MMELLIHACTVKIFLQLSLVLVLLSNGHYINTDHIDCIDTKDNWVRVGSGFSLRINDNDIELLKEAMGVYVK